MKGKESAKI